MPAQTINVSELKNILAAVKGAKPVTIATFTDAKLKKTGNPFSECRKLSRINGFVNVRYEAAVQRQEMREGHAPPLRQSRAHGVSVLTERHSSNTRASII